MNLAEELRKLAELHQAGHLSTQEFTDAKRRLIAEGQTGQDAPDNEEEAVRKRMSELTEKTYKSSRWSSGNLFFPDSLTLSGDGMLFRKGALFGSREEHINYRAVASVCIKNGVFLADVSIETSGGSQPIFLNGLWKSGAKEIQDTIRSSQKGAVKSKP